MSAISLLNRLYTKMFRIYLFSIFTIKTTRALDGTRTHDLHITTQMGNLPRSVGVGGSIIC